MPRGKAKPVEESNGPGEWLVTFSDCMTLLLCFFVLLLTFSSFDDVALQRLAGVFDYRSDNSIFPLRKEVKDSYLPEPMTPLSMTEHGSQAPTTSPPRQVEHPRKVPIILAGDAYRDRKVFYIPSSRLFWGKGTSLTADGRRCMRKIAAFMHAMACRVIIGEAGPSGAGQSGDGLDRAWAIMEFFTEAAGLPRSRFNVTASPAVPPPTLAGQRVIAITLLAKGVY